MPLVGSYPTVSPLPAGLHRSDASPVLPAVIFCSAFHGLATSGNYPASCPMVPGLSSGFARGRLAHSAEILTDGIDEGELPLQTDGFLAGDIEPAVHGHLAQLSAEVPQVHAQFLIATGQG